MGGNPVQILAAENDRAGTGVQKPRNGIQNGGFSGAVRPDKGNDLALVHLEGNALDGVDAAVVDVKITDFQHFCHGYASFLRPGAALITVEW